MPWPDVRLEPEPLDPGETTPSFWKLTIVLDPDWQTFSLGINTDRGMAFTLVLNADDMRDLRAKIQEAGAVAQ